MGQSALCPAKMKRCPAQSRTANAIDTTPAPRKDVAAPAARPKGPAAKKAAQKTPTSRSGGQRGTSTWWYKIPAHGERARCNFVLHNAILLARAAGDRHPASFAAYLLMGLPTMADFRPGGPAASVHSCAHSAVRVGFPTPFLLGRHLAVFRPLRYPPHSILGHDSLSGPVSPQSHSYHTRFPRKSQRSAPCKTALYCRTAKNRRSGAESPCFAGKKDV